MSATAVPSSTDESTQPLDLNGTFGALLIGGLVSALLYGITVLQTLVYYQRSSAQDRWLMKTVVCALWLLDTFDMILISHITYWYLVVNYGNPSSLSGIVWSLVAHLMITALTESVVRSMFLLRVWKLSGGKWLPALTVGIITLADLILGIIVTAKSNGATFSQLQNVEAFVLAEFTTGLSGDVLIALLLCYFLYRSRTGFTRTDSVVTALMAYVINTGLITAVALTVNIVLFTTERRNFAYIALYFVVSKLYVNAYLAMLNARASIRQKMDRIEMTMPLSRFSERRPVAPQFAQRASNDSAKTNENLASTKINAKITTDALP